MTGRIAERILDWFLAQNPLVRTLIICRDDGAPPGWALAGGFIMPEALLTGIVNNAEKYGVFERNTTVWPVDTDAVSRAKKTQGATGYYPDYGQSPIESQIRVGRLRTELTRYSLLVYADRWMLQDTSSGLAVAVGDFIASELGLALAYMTDRNGFVGDGGATFAKVLGLFKLANGHSVTADTGDNTFPEAIDASVKYPTKCAGELPDIADDENLKWYLHRSIFWAFMGVRDDNHRPIADILTRGDRPQRVLCGYPAEVVQVAPRMSDTAASTVMAVLANLKRGHEMYRRGGRMELRVSEHYKFVEGEITFCLDCPQGIATLDENMSCRLVTAAT